MRHKTLLFALSCISFFSLASASADSGFGCKVISSDVSFEVYALTQTTDGFPLMSDLRVFVKSELKGVIERQNIIGYWNERTAEGNLLLLKAIDPSKSETLLEIRFFPNEPQKSIMNFNYNGNSYVNMPINCEFE